MANYTALFERGDGLIVSYINTIWVSAIGTLGGMVVMTAAAYAFSRQFPGRRILFMISIFSMYFGGGLVPTYLNLKNLNLLNTRTGIIMLTLVSVSHIIIIMKGFEAVPKELEEAAKYFLNEAKKESLPIEWVAAAEMDEKKFRFDENGEDLKVKARKRQHHRTLASSSFDRDAIMAKLNN